MNQNLNWEKEFDLFWGVCPEGSPKHKAREKAKEFFRPLIGLLYSVAKPMNHEDTSWEERLDEQFPYMQGVITRFGKENGKTIKEFIAEEIGKAQQFPHNVTEWKKIGDERGYTKFWEERIRAEIKKKYNITQ